MQLSKEVSSTNFCVPLQGSCLILPDSVLSHDLLMGPVKNCVASVHRLS
jgi:hypothetical protein